MNNQEQDKEIQKRVLAQQQSDLEYAFFRAFHGDDEEGMKKAVKQLLELDQRHGTQCVENLFRFLDKVSWIQNQPNREIAAQIVSAIEKKAYEDEWQRK